MKRNINLLIFISILTLFFVACGGEEEEDTGNNHNDGTTDQEVTDEVTDNLSDDTEEIVDDETPDQPVIYDYPQETPTSNKTGDIAHNLEFMDAEGNVRKLGEFYKHKKLIWLVFSAYDCPPCNIEKQSLPKLYKEEYKEAGLEVVMIMNGLLSGPQPNREPEKVSTLKEDMISSYGDNASWVWGYLTSPQQQGFYKFVQQGYPINLFIDGENMEVLQHFEGWDYSMESSKENAIKYFLDLL